MGHLARRQTTYEAKMPSSHMNTQPLCLLMQCVKFSCTDGKETAGAMLTRIIVITVYFGPGKKVQSKCHSKPGLVGKVSHSFWCEIY